MTGMRYQPQGRAALSPEWLNLGLESLTLFQSTEIETVAPSGLFRVGDGHAVNGSRFGRGASQNSGSNFWRVSSGGRTIGSGNQFAIMVAFQLNATGQANKYLVMDGSGLSQSAIILGYVANTIEFFAQGYSGSDPRPGSQIAVNDTNPHVAVYSYDGTTFRGFLDGVEKFSIARSFSLSMGGSIGFIGASNAAGANLANVTMYAHTRFSRGLASETARRLSANPWQIFAEPEEDDYISALAAGYTLSVGAAPMAITASQVGMRVSRQLRTEPASLVIAPGQVGLRASRKLTVAPSALTLATSDVALLASRRLGVLPAAMAITGGQVVGRVSRRLPVAPAAMVMAGGQVSMLYAPKPEPGSYTLSVSAAAMSLTGGNVGMRVARRLRVTPASLALAASAVRTLVSRRLMVSPAGLQLSGGPVTLSFSARGEAFDISKIHPSRLVIFEGSGSRITPFEGSGSRITPFEGSGSRITRFE